MKNLFNFLYSTRLMAILFIVFATAMGIATFIENDYGTQTSKALIYNAWWFEAIMALFVINFFGNIFRYRLYRKEKWAVLLFHSAFLLILIGAGITRYVGYEGIMLIEEGETTNKFLSETTYVNVVVDNNEIQKTSNQPILLSAWGSNSWSYKDDFKGTDYRIELVDYIPWAEKKLVEDENGVEHLFFVESSEGTRHEHWIKKGTIQNIHGVLVGFEAENDSATLNFSNKNGALTMISKNEGDWFRMADQKRGTVVKDSLQEFQYLTLHNIGKLQFVIPKPAEKGIMKTISGPKSDEVKDVIVLDVTANNETKRVELTGSKFNTDGAKNFKLGDLNFRLLYGAKILETPFSIKLNDFQLEKYPGSESAAAYASEITVIDPKETFDYRIYMNHILDHRGYKFFQASYDLSGEREETHLSVNHDFLGTFVTYLGYSLLYTGLICILFAKNTRFDDLKKSLTKIRKKKQTLSVVAALFLSTFAYTQHTENHKPKRITHQQIDSILQANRVDKTHAESFSKLVIQDAGGRMKPAHTFASELVRKVSKTENFKGMEPSQVLLSIVENSRLWFEVPVIYLEKGNTQIRELIGVADTTKRASLMDFISNQGTYKIAEKVAEAQKKKVRNKFEKDLINIDRRVGLLNTAIGGGILKIYPIPNDENNKWISHLELSSTKKLIGNDSVYVPKLLPLYIQLLQSAKKTNNYAKADQVLDGIKNYQKKYGASIYPTDKKIDLEISYNKIQPFQKLATYYGLASVLLLIFVIWQIFIDKKWINATVKVLSIGVVVLFIIHTLSLIARWYISGYAPWSNAYESIIFVAWATMLFGLFMGRKSALTITATAFLVAITLGFAHQNWLDPEIANLQPVLNSWWLLVHTSIIVASYGPLSLGMILGIVALFLMLFTTKKNKKKMDLNMKEITVINEMAITVGLIMLTIGNFLGGMWANESWGRYWGWDPKETWALISIMVYAFVLHMRLIPGLRGRFTFNLWSIIAYASIMMTYFGVNFYLSGLHSYASGDRVITPTSVFYSIGFVAILGSLSYMKYKKYYKK
ncbi:cytochrome c biogenesis protein CcsA [Polaribacter sp.]|uniref:cytochrome c biogenesis protein n=1 Tax=Polaribacter sp. TaxID=1920175 RepID=UPI003F6A6894